MKTRRELEAIKQEWRSFYYNILNINLKLNTVEFPPEVDGFTRPLIVVKPFNIQRMIRYLNAITPVLVKDLEGHWLSGLKFFDEVAVFSDRRPENGDYAVWTKNIMESTEDPEMQYRSANALKQVGISCMTLQEWLIMTLKLLSETNNKNFLDRDSVTLCAGSHARDGNIFAAYYWENCIEIIFFEPNFEGDKNRARKVIV
jgi:hypothetical protein